MKFVFAVVLVFALAVSALPSDVAKDIATVLESDPTPSHKTAEPRFVATRDSGSGTVTFRDDSTSSTPSSSSNDDGESSEFDAQLAQIDEDIRKAKEAVKESEACARRVAEQRASLRNLQEQHDHLEREKEKAKLQAKLDRQMKDMSEINRMSRALKAKFTELKRTQQLIKSKMNGTKSSLTQLDGQADLSTNDLSENTSNIVGEVDAMHQAQNAVLNQAQRNNEREVKSNLNSANKIATKSSKSSDDDDI